MKNLLFTILAAAPVFAYAQDQRTGKLQVKNKPQQYSCQELELTPDGGAMILRKNVKLETENLTLMADSAVFINDNQTWIAYGTKELIFNGGGVVAGEKPNNTVRYKLGDKTIYLE